MTSQPGDNSAELLRTRAHPTVRPGGPWGLSPLVHLDTPEWRDLAPKSVRVLMVLWSMANGSRECWPSQARIAQITGLVPRSVSVATTELDRARFVDKIPIASRRIKYRMINEPTSRRKPRRNVSIAGKVFLNEINTDTFRGLTPKAVRVLHVLWSLALAPRWEAWPPQKRLVAVTGLTRPRVSYAVKELEEAGYLERNPIAGRRLKYCLKSTENRGSIV